MVSLFRRPAVCILLLGMLFSIPFFSDPALGQPALSDQSQISLITILPGDPVYTFAGHSALRVYDPARGIDRLYNYGTFNFGDPLFLPKFTYGHLRYHLSVASYGPMRRFYERSGRPVIEQPLNLTPSQRSRVYQFLQRNARPENRYYQYNFFFDNCSTRIRDVLQKTLGETVRFSNAPAPQRTFRQLLDPYVASRPLMDLGFDLALGQPADRIPTREEAMFLPEHLLHAFNEATVTVDGTQRPLVTQTDTVAWVSNYAATAPAFDWPFALSLAGLVLVLGWTAVQAARRERPSGWGDALLLAVVGCIGLGLCYLWFISTYHVTNNNLNLLWAWPAHLYAAYALQRSPSSSVLRRYLAITAVASFLVVAGWPFWPQQLHPAVWPLVTALGVRAGWWTLLLYGLLPAALSSPSSVAASST